MADSLPGVTTIKETEETQIWASGPDNNHKRFEIKGKIKSTVTDSGNTGFTTTLRGGNVMSLKVSDQLLYRNAPAATDGTQAVVGLLSKHTSMLDRDGVAEDKFVKLLTAGIIKLTTDLIGADKAALAVLSRIGFTFAQLDPHGSCFGLHMKARYFHTADYVLLDADHGTMRVAITNAVNFTLPDLATVGKGYQVLLYNAVDASMVITSPVADKIIFGDAGGGLATTLTYSTANKKMGGTALMYADYGTDGATLQWYVLTSGTVPVAA